MRNGVKNTSGSNNVFIKIIKIIILITIIFGSGYWLGKQDYSLRDIISKIKSKEQSKSSPSGHLEDKEESEEKLTFYQRLISKKEILLSPSKGKNTGKNKDKELNCSKYTLQIASFQKEELARNYINKLTYTSFSPYISPVNLNKHGVWYRVFLGEFSDKNEAIEYGDKTLKPKGIYFLVVELADNSKKR